MAAPALHPDTDERRAHTVAVRAQAAGYQPIITAASEQIFVLLACTPEQLNELLDKAGAPP